MEIIIIASTGTVALCATALALMKRGELKRMEEVQRRLSEKWAILNGEFVEFTAEELAWRATK